MQLIRSASRDYVHPLIDSKRWQAYAPRASDVLICTSYKAGTTWMQQILAQLVFAGAPPLAPTLLSPWFESRFAPLDERVAQLQAQTHQRFIKTHLPLDGLPFYEQVRHVVVVRDTRDVFMSLWNHHTGYTAEALALFNQAPDQNGGEFLPGPSDLREFFHEWITRGRFAWEHDGYPYWSHHHHLATFWPERRRENVLLLHYNDLLADLAGQMRKVASFICIELDESRFAAQVEACTFGSMKKNATELVPFAGRIWKGGGQQFIYKGKNGRWKEVLTAEDVALYERARDRSLPSDAAAWLQHGGSY